MKDKDTRQLRRLRTEVEHICKEQNINLTTTCKRIQCKAYILELIKKLERIEQNESHTSYIEPPQINSTYSSLANDENNSMSSFVKQTLQFEENMCNISYNTCLICHQGRLNLAVKDGICSRCESQRGNYTFCHDNKTLPTWMMGNAVMYSIPPELKNLTLAEKLLIQRVSPLVPVIHIKNGSIGSRGHVVSFFQDISGICNELPKIPSEIQMVKVIRSGTTAAGENISNTFTVNKHRVLTALKWLKKFNPLYSDITIKESNLSWMKGKQSEQLNDVVTVECNEDDEEGEDKDKGPCENQVLEPFNQILNPEDETYGCISSETTQIIHEGDSLLAKAIRKDAKSKVTPKLNWPTREVKPISEYSDTKIFCLAFPWLFPGGIGDIRESRHREVDIGEWAQNLLFYEDGRFAKDKFWSFFTLNFIQRHRNKSQSRWFVKDFVGSMPPTLDSLQEQLDTGDNTFIDKLMYFGKVVPGSAAYWRGKKAELYSWINHHIEKGRGAPNVFMTLSCAEYFWPDLKRLLEECILKAENRTVNLSLSHPELNKALNDYTSVVQEFFHIRVDEYLKTVGLNVFGITHFWGRFEFAKSRGQIHLHLLGITNDAVGKNGISSKLFKWKDNKERQSKILANWARKKFNCTAEVNLEADNVTGDVSPCKLRFRETDSIEKDGQDLCMFCQIHKCNDYCMRKTKIAKEKDNDEANQKRTTTKEVCDVTNRRTLKEITIHTSLLTHAKKLYSVFLHIF